MAGKNTAVFGICQTQVDVEYAGKYSSRSK